MTVQEALRLGASLLAEAGIDDPMRDARRLMAAFLEVEPGRLTLHMHDEFDALAEENYMAAIVERQSRRPMSHLLGYRQFYGRRFDVTSDVLDPRGDTETLIEVALAGPFSRVLDLGTGSGCILLTLLSERSDATGVGTDLSPAALSVAERNSETLQLRDRAELKQADWFDGVSGRFDLIVSNPPYISVSEMQELEPELTYEPRMALTDDDDGLTAYRVICAGAGAFLQPAGRLVVEIGWKQGASVAALFRENGLEQVQILPDLDGRDRVVCGIWPR